MELLRIHECLCDRTRLRILNLLLAGPLCVCHLQDVLREPQVKISRHLAYLRRRGLVSPQRRGQWVIYRLPPAPSRALAAQLACLQDATTKESVFRKDRQRLDRIENALGSACPPDAPSRSARRLRQPTCS